MKKVLLVSLAFPPLPVVGIFRVAKFCKYLPEFGWQPYVLTERIRETKIPGDWAALEEISSRTRITRTINIQPLLWWDNRQADKKASLEQNVRGTARKTQQADVVQLSIPAANQNLGKIQLLRKILSVPDARTAWIPQALLPGLFLIAREKIDVIFSSSPPPTNHALASLLSLFSGRPHVVDYRDLWTLNESYHLRNFPPSLEKFDRSLEKRVLKRCRRIICTTNTFRTKMIENFSFIDEGKIDVIYNGVDESDLIKPSVAPKRNERFTIAYFGGLYGYRDPVPFFKGLNKWLTSEPPAKEHVRVDFWGSEKAHYGAVIDRFGLVDNVHFNSRIPQSEVIAKMFQTDVFLLIQGLDSRSGDSIPTKLFEYMAIGKPILAFMVEGEAANLIKRQSENIVISSDDPDSIAGYLKHHYAIWTSNEYGSRGRSDLPPEFTRKEQTRQLADIFDVIIS